MPGALQRTKSAGCSVLTSPFASLEVAFNNQWANNADAISLLYSGTGALKTDFTRTGKRTVAGALQDGWNSVRRYILNNMVDGRTQDAWDLVLGRYTPAPALHLRLVDKKAATAAGSSSTSPSHSSTGPDGARAKSGGTAQVVSPVVAHRSQLTPMGLLLRTAVLFTSIATLTSALLGRIPHLQPAHPIRLPMGIAVATLFIAGLAGYIVKKGSKPLGMDLVSRPQFVPAKTAVGAGSSGVFATGSTRQPSPAPVSGREKTA